jgi:hypothetical protein
MDGGDWCAAIAQRAVRVVFDQQGIILFNDRRDVPATFQRDRSAGRILKSFGLYTN